MKEMRLTILINKPVEEVFSFTLDPKNTPLWVDSIVREQTNEWPVKNGTVYRNQNRTGVWSEYEVTLFDRNKKFVFNKKKSFYRVAYTFTAVADRVTRVEYYEWVESGTLEDPFTLEILVKLKSIIEQTI
jgi:uncharacterized protein YndB with AHSA1/START domain